MGRLEELSKNTLIITLGKLSTQFLSFILLPLYTHFLSTDEYGIVDLVLTIVQLLNPVCSIMIDQAVFRFLLSCKNDKQKKYIISSGFVVIIFLNIITIILYIIFGTYISVEYKEWLIVLVIINVFLNYFLQVSRGLKNTKVYSFGSLISTLSSIIFNIVCIVILHLGALGILISTFLGNFVCIIYLFFRLKIYNYIKISYVDMNCSFQQVRYAIPLIPNQLSLWVMNSSDRFIVSVVLGMGANGLLAVTHKFPAAFMIIYNIFLLAWHETGVIHYFDEDRDNFFSDILEKVFSIFASFCVLMIAALPFVFRILISKAYYEAYNNIPIYLIAFLFNVVIGFLGVVYVAVKKTIEISKSTIIAAAFNFVINILLINHIGLYAASISTLLGYAITMIYRIIDIKKYIKIKYSKKLVIKFSTVIMLSCLGYYIDNLVITFLISVICIALLYFVNREYIIELRNMIKGKLKK